MSRIFLGDKNAFSVEERMNMERKYIYENAIIYVKIHNESSDRIYNATEKFLRKVILEKENKK